jgi:hypothetical protein
MNRRTAILTAAAAVLSLLWGRPQPRELPHIPVVYDRARKLLADNQATAMISGYLEAKPGSATRQRIMDQIVVLALKVTK